MRRQEGRPKVSKKGKIKLIQITICLPILLKENDGRKVSHLCIPNQSARTKEIQVNITTLNLSVDYQIFRILNAFQRE
jgi:hypothetical protein